jgi:CheY-like chemotaxis protein
MPEMDGFETIAKLRGNPHLGRIPVIFLTADTSDETEV